MMTFTPLIAAALLSELPVERPYQFRSDLETVHLADRRDATAVRATNEFAFVRGQSIAVAKDLGEVADRALVDFQDYLRVSMDVDVLTGAAPGECPALSVCRDDTLRAREYAVDVTVEGVVVRAKDGRAAAQALYHLEDLMNLREAPFLTFGKGLRRDRFETRMTHSGYGECAFEDAYLSHLAHAGINAIMFFMTGIDTVESLGGYRADNRFDLNAIIRRAKRFGIDTYIYCIFHCFAHPRDPGGKEILDKTFGRILGNYPEAKGTILIGESCEFPSRDPRVQPVSYLNKDPKDPRPAAGWFPCSDRAEWLEAVKESIHRRAPNMEIVLFTYNWGWAPEADRCKLIDSLPKDISVMSEWEMFQRRTMSNGIESPTADYTIAVPGAGSYFTSEAACAHRNGLKLYTMATAGGRTWDFGCAPYVPVPDQWLRRWRGLVDANAKWNLTGIMENHDYGWLPSFLGEIEKEAYAEGGLPYGEHIRRIAARDFGVANAARVVAIWKRWSDEMNNYIPSDVNQYGSFRTGPAYPFVIGKEPVKEGEIPGANPTCCLRLDYLNTGFVFAEKKERVDDEYFRKEIELFELPLRGYEEGAAAFLDMADSLAGRKRANALRMANLAGYLASYYRTAINLKRLAIAHRNGDEAGYLAAARAEYVNVKDALDCVSRDSRLGYENNLDYAGGAEQLSWKLRRMERDFGKDNLTEGKTKGKEN